MANKKALPIRIYEYDTTSFNNNGICTLFPTNAVITRSLNDFEYALDLTHPIDDFGKWKEIVEDRIIKANNQLFRIKHITKTMNDITAYCEHIFFDLQQNFIEDTNIVNKNGMLAIDQILSHTVYSHPFSGTSDIDIINNSRMVRKNVLTALIGDDDNSFINRWGSEGAELDIDNFNFKINKRIGSDNGYKIEYGKNLIGVSAKFDMTNVVTVVRPVGFDGIELSEDDKYVYSPYVDNYAVPIIREYKYEDVKWKGSPNYESPEDGEDDGAYETLEEAQAELKRLAELEFTDNKIDVPSVTYDIDFVELSNTEEYQDYLVVAQIGIGDNVTIKHKLLGIDIPARCISYEYDCLTCNYNEITLGHYNTNFFSDVKKAISNSEEINKTIQQLPDKMNEMLMQAKQYATEYVNGGWGGYLYYTPNGLYILDNQDINLAKNVAVLNMNGLAFGNNGINGTFETAITRDGHIVANFIDTGVLNAGIVKSGILESLNGKSWINMEDGSFSFANGALTYGEDGFVLNGYSTSDDIESYLTSSGGWNRVKNGCFYNNTSYWNEANGANIEVINNDATINEYGTSLKIISNATSGLYQNIENLKIDKTYTLSCYFKGTSSGGVYLQNENSDVIGATSASTNTWVKLILPFEATTETMTVKLGYNSGTFYYTAIQLEDGEFATSWCPNPNEIYQGITRIDNDGVIIETNSDLNERTIIDAYGMEVQKGGNTLASFREKSYIPYLYSDNISCPNMVTKGYYNNIYYVNGTNGNDMNDGKTSSTAFATIQKAIDELPDLIAYDVNIYVNGSVPSFVMSDKSGNGLVNIILNNGAYIKGDITISGGSNPIRISSNKNSSDNEFMTTNQGYNRDGSLDGNTSYTRTETYISIIGDNKNATIETGINGYARFIYYDDNYEYLGYYDTIYTASFPLISYYNQVTGASYVRFSINQSTSIVLIGGSSVGGTTSTGSCINGQLKVKGTRNFELDGITFDSTGINDNSTVVLERNTMITIQDCEFLNNKTYCISNFRGTLMMKDNIGNDVSYALEAKDYSIIYLFNGKIPNYTSGIYNDNSNGTVVINIGDNLEKTNSETSSSDLPTYTESDKQQEWECYNYYSVEDYMWNMTHNGSLRQGFSTYGKIGRWRGYINFDHQKIREVIQGSSNLSGQIYMQRSYLSKEYAGATTIGLYASDGTVIDTTTTLNQDEGKWISIPTSVLQKIIDGTVTYFYVAHDADDLSHFIYYDTVCKIKLNYSK